MRQLDKFIAGYRVNTAQGIDLAASLIRRSHLRLIDRRKRGAL